MAGCAILLILVLLIENSWFVLEVIFSLYRTVSIAELSLVLQSEQSCMVYCRMQVYRINFQYENIAYKMKMHNGYEGKKMLLMQLVELVIAHSSIAFIRLHGKQQRVMQVVWKQDELIYSSFYIDLELQRLHIYSSYTYTALYLKTGFNVALGWT